MKKPVTMTVIADLMFFIMIFSEIQFDMSQHNRMLLFGLVSAAGAILIIWALLKEISTFIRHLQKKKYGKSELKTPGILLSILFSSLSLIYVGRFFLVWILVSNV